MMPSETQQREAAEDVAHEITLFGMVAEHLHTPPPGERDRFQYQLWYILARNLMDFFDMGRGDRHDDEILAEDFVDPPQDWHAVREVVPVPADYGAYRVAANKRAAHLTYARAEYRNRYAPSPEVSKYLMILAALFLEKVEPAKAGWFAKTQFKMRLKKGPPAGESEGGG